MAYKLGIGHTQRFYAKFWKSGCQRVGRRERSEQNFFLNTPFARFGAWCINNINLRLPGGGIFYLKYCHCAGLKTDRLQKRNEKSDDLTQANLFRSVGTWY